MGKSFSTLYHHVDTSSSSSTSYLPIGVQTLSSNLSSSSVSSSSSSSSNSNSSCTLLNAIVNGNSELCQNLLLKGGNVLSESSRTRLQCVKHEYNPGESTFEFINHLHLPKELHSAALHVACMCRRPLIIQMLLESGVDPNVRDLSGRTPVHMTILYWPHVSAVKDETNMTSRETRYQQYFRELHDNSTECLGYLHQYGADMNARVNNWMRDTALHMAARQNKTSCLDSLIKFACDLEAKDADGRTPVMVAARQGSLEIMMKLILEGAQANITDNYGMTLLHLLCGTAHALTQYLVARLIEEGLDINSQNHRGNTPLHIAASSGNEFAIDILLQSGANPNIRNTAKQSVLFLLLDRTLNANKVSCVHKLISETTQIHIYDASNDLPLLLNRKDMGSLKQFLLDISAKPSTLQHLSRQVIRQAFGKKNLNSDSLNLINYPNRLKDYILHLDFTMDEIHPSGSTEDQNQML